MGLKTLVAGLAAGAAAGVAVAIHFGLNAPVAWVRVTNLSAQPVTAVTLHIQACGGRQTLTRQGLEPGARARLGVPICGEGGYTLAAELADGTRLEGRGRYLERGYRSAEDITGEGIQGRYLRTW